MKKSSKFLSVILTLIMVISIIPMSNITSNAATYSGKCGDNLTWTFNGSTGILTISGTGAMGDYYTQSLISEDWGYEIVSWFEHELQRPWEDLTDKIKKVVINNGVTSIDDYAFANCINLTSVSIPNSVVDMGGAVFYNCSALKSVTLPNKIKTLNSVHYYENFREGLDYIYYYQYQRADGFFEGCTSLNNIIIPNSVTSIDDFAFAGCSSLVEITIPNSVENIGGAVFYDCTALEKVFLSDKITELDSYIDRYHIRYALGYDHKEIYGFFENCTSLTTITIPDSVKEIGDFAFENSGLINVVIPNTVENMGGAVFYNCSSLETATLSNNVTTLDSFNYYVPYVDLEKYCGFFTGCYSLKSVLIPDSVTKIGFEIFLEQWEWAYCDNLTDIYYGGTEEQWNDIEGNPYILETTTIHFESTELFCPVSEEWEIVKEPTCTEKGMEEKTCPHGKGERSEIPALGHDYGDFTIDVMPTCTTVGSKSQHCSRCNSKINVTSVSATGHTLTWHTLSVASCQTDGVAHGYCDNCDYFEVKTTPSTGHIYKSVVTKPTCTESGYTTHTCTCGDSYITDEIPATGHVDSNGDGECDSCDYTICDHDCHKGGITGFFWKISNFFNRLFRSNKYCECGVAHY